MRKLNPPLSKINKSIDAHDFSRPMRRKSISMAELMQMEFPGEEPLLGSVITYGSTGMLSAPRGKGKTLLALRIIYATAAGKFLKPWGRGIGCVVTYLDGEMHGRNLQDRLRQTGNSDSFDATRQKALENIHIIGRDLFKHDIGYIDDEEGQALIESLLPDNCRLLVIDNLSAWTSSAREDGSAFAPIKRWLLRLRAKGIAVLLVHHTGKNGSQRGTSVHEDLLDYSILLREDKSCKPKNGTSFLVEHTKLRELHPNLPKVFRYTFTTDPDTDVMEHLYEDDITEPFSKEKLQIVELLKKGMSGIEIRAELGVTTSAITRLKKSLPADEIAEIEAAQAARKAAQKTGKE